MSEQLYKDAYQELHAHFLLMQSLLGDEIRNALSGEPLSYEMALKRRGEMLHVMGKVADLNERLYRHEFGEEVWPIREQASEADRRQG